MDFSILKMIWEGLLLGAGVTVAVTLFSLIIAWTLGFCLALVRHFSGIIILNFVIDAIVEYFRNIPALTHLFIIYFGLGAVGIRLDSIPAAILGLGIIGAAITSEIFRSSFQSINKGQNEAALAVGFTPLQTIRFILTPQAMRIALPSLGNYALQLMKDTSIVSAIAAPEIMFYARSMVTSSFQTTLIYSSAALLYLLLSLPLAKGVHLLEVRYGRKS